MTRQSVEGGDSSFNLQAGENVAVIIHQGASLAEVKTYVQGIFLENFLKLTGEAERIAEQRARQITEDFLNRLHAKDPFLMESLRDPAMLSAVYEAQASFAKSGEDDLAAVLVGLLLDRAQETHRNLRSIVLEGAISVAPRITTAQREALGMAFAARHITELSETREQYVKTRIIEGFLPLTANLKSVRFMDLQHLEYLGCGSNIFGISLQETLAIPRYFARGFDPTTLSERLRAVGLTISDPNSDDQELCVFAPWVHDTRMKEGAAELLQEFESEIDERIKETKLNREAAREALRPWVPNIDQLSQQWNTSGLQNFTLTSVGIAIGHSYWSSTVGDGTPLSVWIP